MRRRSGAWAGWTPRPKGAAVGRSARPTAATSPPRPPATRSRSAPIRPRDHRALPARHSPRSQSPRAQCHPLRLRPAAPTPIPPAPRGGVAAGNGDAGACGAGTGSDPNPLPTREGERPQGPRPPHRRGTLPVRGSAAGAGWGGARDPVGIGRGRHVRARPPVRIPSPPPSPCRAARPRYRSRPLPQTGVGIDAADSGEGRNAESGRPDLEQLRPELAGGVGAPRRRVVGEAVEDVDPTPVAVGRRQQARRGRSSRARSRWSG